MFNKFKSYKNKVEIYDESQNLSFNKLLIETNKIKKKINKRSLILLISENSIGTIISYIFCLLNNHVLIIIDSKSSEKNIKNILSKYKPDYIFCSLRYTKKNFEKIFDFYNNFLFKNKIRVKKKLNKNLCVLLSTSGSMNSNKFVKLSKKNIKSNTLSIIKYLKLKSNDSAISSLPISYSYMLSVINSHLQVGGSIAVTSTSIVQKKFWSFYKKSKCTSFNGVPYNYEILSKVGLNNLKIKSLKYITQAGGKLEKKFNLELIKFCNKNKLKLFTMYGQTEASPRISYLEPRFSLKKIGSIGKAIPNTKLYLIDDLNNKIKKPFERGEIVCEGSNVFMGYSNEYKDLDKDYECGIKLKTGDIGYFDKDDFFFLTSRKNKIAKIYGNRVDIEQLESLMSSKGFKIFCVAYNNKIAVFSDKRYKNSHLINTLSNETNLNFQVFEYYKLKKFPRTDNGKISYIKLKNYIDDRL